MDSNIEIHHRKRGLIFLGIAALMLILGETALRQVLSSFVFVIYWLACFVFTALAILYAFLDVSGLQRQAREQQRELLEKTVREIARQKDLKTGQSKSTGGSE